MATLLFGLPLSMEDDFTFFSGNIIGDTVGSPGGGASLVTIDNNVGDRAIFLRTFQQPVDQADINFGLLTNQTIINDLDIVGFTSGARILPLDDEGNPIPNAEVDGITVDVRVFDVEVEVLDFNQAVATGNTLRVWELFAEGNDLIRGSTVAFDDEFFGFSGNDVVEGGGGNDALFGGSGNDKVRGQDGNDEVSGGSGKDTVVGGDGDDLLMGGSGDDVLRGGAGIDVLRGGKGDDRLAGKSSADELRGGAGDDTMIGGGGADLFVFGANSGDDLVIRFRQGVDAIQINGATRLADLDISADGDNAVIEFGNSTITFRDEDPANFTADDFIF